MKEMFIPKRFNRANAALIAHANEIIKEYMKDGFTLTLRQLYYQFVSRDLIPNKQESYDRLGETISAARLAGEIDWDAIEDRSRNHKPNDGVFESPEDILQAAWKSYRIPFWSTQPNHVEVWVEKEALSGVLDSVCRKFKVIQFSCKGYTSQSEMYGAGKRVRDAIAEDKEVHIIHLGDHDPSGIDMTRDIEDRLIMFGFLGPGCCDQKAIESGDCCWECREWYCRKLDKDVPIRIHRIALNFDQIKKYNPPPNPAKTTDCRFESYRKMYGTESWELDALEPRLIQGLIAEEIESLLDKEEWQKKQIQENEEKDTLKYIFENFDEINQMKNKAGQVGN